MKSTFQIIALVLSIVFVLLLTSCLLDVDWVSAHWVRQLIVLLLMLLELVIGAYMFWLKSKEMV